MNKNKVACIILVMILAGVAYGTQIMQKKSSAMKEESEGAASEYENARSKCERAEMSLGTYTASTADLLSFLETWTSAVERLSSGQEAESALMNIVRNSGVLTMSQKFEVKDHHSSGIVPRCLLGTLIVQDDYAKTMNFLGEIERTIPLVRITACHIKQGDTGSRINLELHIEIPLVNLQADPDDAKKK